VSVLGRARKTRTMGEKGLGITTEDELLLLGILLASIFRLYESGLAYWG